MTPYGYASRFDIHFDDKFEVSFGREGETMSLGCRVVITPEIKHFQLLYLNINQMTREGLDFGCDPPHSHPAPLLVHGIDANDYN